MKIREWIEDLKNRLMPLEIRVAMVKFKLSEIPRKLRGLVAEHIVAVKLHELRMKCDKRYVCSECRHENMPEHTDLLAYKPFIKNPVKVPVQVKSISLWKHGYQVSVEDSSLKDFEGFYIILIEHEPEDYFLYIKSAEMQRLMQEQNPDGPQKRGKARPHNYWNLKIPQNLDGFIHYRESDEFIDAVLTDPYQDEGAE
ncbi:MAG: hypothetical protein E3J73_04315 [Candidatus Bathyarchaeum sp.]|nr:MAG: hypothetical protein E3J73_04315 [Candidatus Bathyarchaeum sp.]